MPLVKFIEALLTSAKEELFTVVSRRGEGECCEIELLVASLADIITVSSTPTDCPCLPRTTFWGTW